ncbi:hypothetical protein GOP47_0005544 [Adiantum capillus-veneris]|uniref:Major facilitator superfamily (MFS) profile domain-containing protein n=1 Tax=Adiantum capillus-veneris TaxID=13818 RepID=A0A9D4ZP82_ADICA|nr:hypothetical protein GOP47_0005544 [Adiantum capillus-veneris]
MSRNGCKPAGFYFLSRVLPNGGKYSFEACKMWVLLLTFVAYALFHASRKPLSIVKNALIADGNLPERNITAALPMSWPLNLVFVVRPSSSLDSNHSLQSGWPPFDGKQGPALLGQVDLAFLASYALSIFIAGHLGDRVCLRLLLSCGMVGSGIFVVLFGCGYWWNLHWLSYFLMVQVVSGLFQATGWPSVVAVVSNWFGKSKRGLIMGVWNAHTSVGNICGTLMASAMLQYGWGWSFLVPGVAISVGGVLVFLLLPIDPEDAGFPSAPHELPQDKLQNHVGDKGYVIAHGTELAGVAKSLDDDSNCQPLLERESNGFEPSSTDAESLAVSFFDAWVIPRVAPFAFCLFFTKLVAYTFLYWLPFYIRHTEIDGHYLSEATAGNLSTVFDVGGTIGGIMAGHLSDKLNARAMVAAAFTYASLPALVLYRIYAVSADLGTRETFSGNSRSLATVTAIIDGTGSIGAAMGPLLTGYLSKAGWNPVFAMLCLSATVAGLLLTGLVLEESREYATSMKLARRKSSQIDLV